MNKFVAPVGLLSIMFGLGLSLGAEDFKRVVEFPKAAVIGLVGQMVLLPAIAFLLTSIMPLAPALAVGLVIISACPGGVTSNAFVFALGADVALSVTLTAISSILTVLTVPILVAVALNVHMDVETAPELPILRMIGQLFLLSVAPIVLGMTVRRIFRRTADRLQEVFRRVTLIILITVIGGAILASYDLMTVNIATAGPICIALNIATMLLGYLAGTLFSLPLRQRITITYEIGLQNVAIAIFITLTLLKDPALGVVPIIYAVTMQATALGLYLVIRTKKLLAIQNEALRETN